MSRSRKDIRSRSKQPFPFDRLPIPGLRIASWYAIVRWHTHVALGLGRAEDLAHVSRACSISIRDIYRVFPHLGPLDRAWMALLGGGMKLLVCVPRVAMMSVPR